MQRRKLGNTGFEVAPLAFGGNVFGWTVDEATSFRLLDAFVAAGFNLIDTADSYSRWVPGHQGGESETDHRALDRAARTPRRRDHRDQGRLRHGPGPQGAAQGLHPAGGRSVAARLQVDCIDLYQSHWDDEKTPFEETLGAYDQLLRQGKVKAIGASNLSAARLAQALEVSETKHAAALRDAAAALQPVRARELRGRAAGALRAREARRDHLFLARRGIPHRQVPVGGGFRQERARTGHEEVPESARHEDPRCARRRRASATTRRRRRSRSRG